MELPAHFRGVTDEFAEMRESCIHVAALRILKALRLGQKSIVCEGQ